MLELRLSPQASRTHDRRAAVPSVMSFSVTSGLVLGMVRVKCLGDLYWTAPCVLTASCIRW